MLNLARNNVRKVGMNINYQLTVFFDGSCPLCMREIGMYRRLESLNPINWLDVSVSDPQQHGIGLSQCDAMRRFHVMDQQGNLFSGAAAFSKLWQQFRGWRVLGYICSLPILSHIAEFSYRGFLKIRPLIQKLVQQP